MRTALSAVLAVPMLVRGMAAPLPPPTRLSDRLAMFPTKGLALERPVTVWWNDHQVPFIDAQTDDDAAYVLGLVHAHLRLGQMELGRRIAQGRLAEIGGPFFIDVDRALRTVGLTRAVPAILESMDPATRRWVDRYVAGINYYQRTMRRAPQEYRVLGLRREPWTAADVIAIGRLSGIDVTWLVWFSLLRLRGKAGWERLWQETLRLGAGLPTPTADQPAERAVLVEALLRAGRTGSNSVVVGGGRSASGAGLIANDPHLGLALPNLWLVAGLRSPSYHVVGMMAPGLPAFAFGRNRDIAWGGTNLRATASDLVDVSDLPAAAFETRREKIPVRMWFAAAAQYRVSPYGPVVSDAPLVPAVAGRSMALAWIGHRPSDELTALLAASRAADWASFRAAFGDFAVPGQNFLYADVHGHVGHLLAARLPRRNGGPPADIVTDRETHDADWAETVGSDELPALFDPPEGFIASANNRPPWAEVPIGFFFSPPERVERLRQLLAAGDSVDVAALMALQRDVLSPSSLALAQALMARLEAPGGGAAATALAGWDGRYETASAGALAFEALLGHAAPGLLQALGEINGSAAWDGSSHLKQRLLRDLERIADATLRPILAEGLAVADATLARYRNWGEVHRVRLRHPFAAAPLVGGRYRMADFGTAGSQETVLKSAHPPVAGEVAPHGSTYGSQARHVSDMADPDANWFTLLGGQDGWLGSSTFIDQVPLWQDGRAIRVPLRLETVAAEFRHVIRLEP